MFLPPHPRHRLPPTSPFGQLPTPPDTGSFPALPWHPEMRLTVPAYASPAQSMSSDVEELENISPHPTTVIQRIVANLPVEHPLMRQISNVHTCVADCAMTLNKVLDFDESNQRVVENKLDYFWSYVRDVGEYCQTNFQATNVDLATLRRGLDTVAGTFATTLPKSE